MTKKLIINAIIIWFDKETFSINIYLDLAMNLSVIVRWQRKKLKKLKKMMQVQTNLFFKNVFIYFCICLKNNLSF